MPLDCSTFNPTVYQPSTYCICSNHQKKITTGIRTVSQNIPTLSDNITQSKSLADRIFDSIIEKNLYLRISLLAAKYLQRPSCEEISSKIRSFLNFFNKSDSRAALNLLNQAKLNHVLDHIYGFVDLYIKYPIFEKTHLTRFLDADPSTLVDCMIDRSRPLERLDASTRNCVELMRALEEKYLIGPLKSSLDKAEKREKIAGQIDNIINNRLVKLFMPCAHLVSYASYWFYSKTEATIKAIVKSQINSSSSSHEQERLKYKIGKIEKRLKSSQSTTEEYKAKLEVLPRLKKFIDSVEGINFLNSWQCLMEELIVPVLKKMADNHSFIPLINCLLRLKPFAASLRDDLVGESPRDINKILLNNQVQRREFYITLIICLQTLLRETLNNPVEKKILNSFHKNLMKLKSTSHDRAFQIWENLVLPIIKESSE